MGFTLFVIDDHQMIVDWYKQVLHKQLKGATILSALSVQGGMELLENTTELHVLVVDYNLGRGGVEDGFVDGVGFALLAKQQFPAVKVLFITGHEGSLVLYDIHKKLMPEALLLKMDVTEDVLVRALQQVLDGERYYSDHANEALRAIYKKEALLQEQNIQILLLLDKGFKIKEISEALFLIDSAINKRIAGLKQTFDVSDNGGLIKKVKEEGFI